LTKNPSLQKMIKESTGLGIEPAQNLPADALPSTGLNIIKQIQEVFSGRLFGVTGGDFPAVPRKGFDPNITKKNLQLFDEIGFTGTNKLDIQDMLYGIDAEGKPLMSQYKRRVLKAGIGDETFNWSAFTQNRDEVVKDFLDGLQDLKIDPKTIHGHHISALRITSSLFDGLSPIQRKKLIKVFQREGLQLGNHPSNLLALHKSTHLDVVHPFLEQQVGKYGQLLLDPAKMKKLNPRQREGLVKKFAKIIKRSEEIAMENTQTWLSKTFENMSPQAAFDARMDMLNKAFDDDIAFREKLLKSVKSKEPLLPYQAEDIEIPDIPKAKKTRVTSKQTKFKNLVKKIKTENPNTKQMTIWDISDEALDAYRKLF
jgi:stress-induced morphogen